MEIRRESGNGIRGWSVRQKQGPLQAAQTREERNWREILDASKGRLIRGAILGLAAWGALGLVLGEKGLLRLQSLRAEEARLRHANSGLAEERAQVLFELKEDPGLSMERVLREQYRKSLKNEIVLQAVPVRPDSGSGWTAPEQTTKSDQSEQHP